MHRIGKYTTKNTICKKICRTTISSNINELLDFFKLLFIDEFINEIVRETNNAIQKLEGKILLLYLL